MKTANVKLSGQDDSINLKFSLDMNLSVANVQKIMVYTIELKVKEEAEASTKVNDMAGTNSDSDTNLDKSAKESPNA